MANFTEKFTGTTIKGGKFTALSSSIVAAAGNVVDGKKFEILSGSDAIAKLPYRVKKGDQAKFFPGLKEGTSNGRIETGSVFRDTTDGIVYIGIKKKNYQENLIGVDSHISTSFSSSAYLQCSAAFAALYSNVPDDTIFTYAIEEFYSSPSASKAAAFVGPLTASFNVFVSGTLTSSFSAIDLVDTGDVTPKRTPNFTFNFPTSNYITHFEFSNGYSGSLENTTAQFGGGNGVAGLNVRAQNLINSPFVGPAPGNDFTVNGLPVNGTAVWANPVGSNSGRYVNHVFKSKVAGDADSGSKYTFTQFTGQVHIAVYDRFTKDYIHSGSFQYHSGSRSAATGSSIIKTLYFHSASSGAGENTQDYQFFVTSAASTLTNGNTYTMVHQDVDLRTTAPAGFYSPSGSQFTSSVYVQTASGVNSGLGPTFASQYQTGN
jgi:hypothetical protein